MTFDEFKIKRVGKSYQETPKLGKQCVALAKLFSNEVNGIKLKNFSGSALKGRETGSPFVGLPYTRSFYTGKGFPPRGSIVFFNKTKSNPYGHVAITGQCDKDTLRVIEQNAVHGSGLGINGDEISIRGYPYKGGKTGDVLGRYTCTMQF